MFATHVSISSGAFGAGLHLEKYVVVNYNSTPIRGIKQRAPTGNSQIYSVVTVLAITKS